MDRVLINRPQCVVKFKVLSFFLQVWRWLKEIGKLKFQWSIKSNRKAKQQCISITNLASSVPHFLRIEVGGVCPKARGINSGQLPWVMLHKLGSWKGVHRSDTQVQRQIRVGGFSTTHLILWGICGLWTLWRRPPRRTWSASGSVWSSWNGNFCSRWHNPTAPWKGTAWISVDERIQQKIEQISRDGRPQASRAAFLHGFQHTLF